MSSRAPTNGNDANIFRRTAVRTKKVNINPKSMRGGIRL